MKQPQLARLETGQVEPKLDTLQRLAEALGCRVRVNFEPAHTTASVASRKFPRQSLGPRLLPDRTILPHGWEHRAEDTSP